MSLQCLQSHLSYLVLRLAEKLFASRQQHLLILTLDLDLNKSTIKSVSPDYSETERGKVQDTRQRKSSNLARREEKRTDKLEKISFI